MNGTWIPIIVHGNGPEGLGKEIGKNGNQRKSRDHTNYRFNDIGYNTLKSPGDLKRLVFT